MASRASSSRSPSETATPNMPETYVREEIHERPSQFILRCRDASGVAAQLFTEDHITEIKLNEDRQGMLVMTRDRERFSATLGRIACNGHAIDTVVPADENVDSLYEYLIGGE